MLQAGLILSGGSVPPAVSPRCSWTASMKRTGKTELILSSSVPEAPQVCTRNSFQTGSVVLVGLLAAGRSPGLLFCDVI